MIETHYHLDKLPPESRDSLLASWFAQGLEAIVAPAMDRDSLDQVLEIAQSAPGKVFPAAGLHPERNWQGEQGKAALRQAEALCRWIEQNRDTIWAIGEIGLPWYSLEGGEAPKAAFQALELFLETARRTDLPLILHAVHDMARPCLERLQAYGVKRAVFHWLKAPDFVAQAIAEAGYYASLTPEYICFERDQRLAEAEEQERLRSRSVPVTSQLPRQPKNQEAPRRPALARLSLSDRTGATRDYESFTRRDVELAGEGLAGGKYTVVALFAGPRYLYLKAGDKLDGRVTVNASRPDPDKLRVFETRCTDRQAQTWLVEMAEGTFDPDFSQWKDITKKLEKETKK